MNIFNRILVIVLALATVVGAGAVFLVAVDAFQPADLAPTTWLRERLAPFDGMAGADYRWTLGVTLALVLLGLALLWLELTPRRGQRTMTLQEDQLGRVTVNRGGIEDLVNREALRSPGVRESHATVVEENGRLRVRTRVGVARDANAAAISADLRQRLKGSVEQHLGRPVDAVNVETETVDSAPRSRVR